MIVTIIIAVIFLIIIGAVFLPLLLSLPKKPSCWDKFRPPSINEEYVIKFKGVTMYAKWTGNCWVARLPNTEKVIWLKKP